MSRRHQGFVVLGLSFKTSFQFFRSSEKCMLMEGKEPPGKISLMTKWVKLRFYRMVVKKKKKTARKLHF